MIGRSQGGLRGKFGEKFKIALGEDGVGGSVSGSAPATIAVAFVPSSR